MTTAGYSLGEVGFVVTVVAGLNIFTMSSSSNSPTGTVSGMNAATVNVTGLDDECIAYKVAYSLAIPVAAGTVAIAAGESTVEFSSYSSSAFVENSG